MWAHGCVVLVYRFKSQLNYSLPKSCVWSISEIIFETVTGNKLCQHLEIFQKLKFFCSPGTGIWNITKNNVLVLLFFFFPKMLYKAHVTCLATCCVAVYKHLTIRPGLDCLSCWRTKACQVWVPLGCTQRCSLCLFALDPAEQLLFEVAFVPCRNQPCFQTLMLTLLVWVVPSSQKQLCHPATHQQQGKHPFTPCS